MCRVCSYSISPRYGTSPRGQSMYQILPLTRPPGKMPVRTPLRRAFPLIQILTLRAHSGAGGKIGGGGKFFSIPDAGNGA